MGPSLELKHLKIFHPCELSSGRTWAEDFSKQTTWFQKQNFPKYLMPNPLSLSLSIYIYIYIYL